MVSSKSLQISDRHYDVLIVGASIAGSILALALARKNWRVAILEKREDPQFFKKICTHIIHPGGVKQLQKVGIGVSDDTTSASATAMKLMHENLHAFFPPGGQRKAANIERRDIDPALKQRLSETPNIDFYQGYHLKHLLRQGQNIIGGQCVSATHTQLLYAGLVVAADGRHSDTARMAGGREHTQENGRVAMFSYFAYPGDDTGNKISMPAGKAEADSLIWALRQGNEYIGYFPNRQRILVSWYLSREAYQQLPGAKEQAFDQVITFLEQQNVRLGQRQEHIAVAKQTSPLRMSCRAGNFAMVGDAKLAADPLTGVGCSWAISSATLLAQCLPSLETTVSAPPHNDVKATSRMLRWRLRAGVGLYNLLHALKYRAPSYCMTFMSMHGKWIYRRPVFSWAARLSARNKEAQG